MYLSRHFSNEMKFYLTDSAEGFMNILVMRRSLHWFVYICLRLHDFSSELLGLSTFFRCSAEDLKMFVRLIKHDLRINAGAKHM